MEKTLKSNNEKELMRMAMLKHEETFREQVNELHRLYRIQKMLMESVGVNKQQQQEKQNLERYNLLESSKNPSTIDHYRQQLVLQQQPKPQRESNGKIRMLEEGDIELTLSLGPSSCNPRRRKMGKSESGQSISSSSTGSSQTRKTSPKENNTITWAGFPHQGSGMEPGFSNGQQNSNPPWLYQALSLKLT
ncbi:uncharacterized protein LOC130820998 isoform X2 [Amaranthus tricolor]|uniref:uncharacterized protein LOC130820998 isoform X2 n=1 Tax=Amaranthus tricolor TaxID=29722 RepID=UPI00258A62C8|nr:uncharacterized protein LOC130820998 isoform X2 [Amaranthus tricolor]